MDEYMAWLQATPVARSQLRCYRLRRREQADESIELRDLILIATLQMGFSAD